VYDEIVKRNGASWVLPIRADREGDHARLVPTGPFDLAHAMEASREVENSEAHLSGCTSVDVDLAQLDRIDGAGAVLLAPLLDRLDVGRRQARIYQQVRFSVEFNDRTSAKVTT